MDFFHMMYMIYACLLNSQLTLTANDDKVTTRFPFHMNCIRYIIGYVTIVELRHSQASIFLMWKILWSHRFDEVAERSTSVDYNDCKNTFQIGKQHHHEMAAV